VVSGKLVGTNVSGQTITLRSDPFPFDKFSNAGTIATNATGDYTVTPRWESRPITVGAPIAKPSPIFTKLDPSVVEEELARLKPLADDESV